MNLKNNIFVYLIAFSLFGIIYLGYLLSYPHHQILNYLWIVILMLGIVYINTFKQEFYIPEKFFRYIYLLIAIVSLILIVFFAFKFLGFNLPDDLDSIYVILSGILIFSLGIFTESYLRDLREEKEKRKQGLFFLKMVLK